jgi:F-type H+-transporting ATPase subunit a
MVAMQISDKRQLSFLPLCTNDFFFIWLTILLSLIPPFPGGANVTGSIYGGYIGLALITLITVNLSGNKIVGTRFQTTWGLYGCYQL